MNWIKTWVPRLLTGVASIILFLVLARAAILFFTYDWKVVTFPFPVDYGEGPILDQVMRLARFQNLYRPNPTEIPFTISNYPPAYHIAQLPFAWIFGPAYWYGRGISMLSIIAAAIFITLILQTLTRDWLAALFGGLTLFSIPYILHWSPYCRVDSFALGLSMAGLYVIVRWPQARGGLIISSLLLTAAIYTRQSYALAAPITAFIWLVSRKPRLQAFKLAFLVGGFSLALFILLMLLSRGSFYYNIVTANVNQFFWQTVKNYATAIWDHMPYFVISSVLFLILAVWFKVPTWWLVAPYLVTAAASAVTIGKDGSNVNYLFELSAAFSLVAGAIIAIPRKRLLVKSELILILAVQVFFIYNWTRMDYYRWTMSRVDFERRDISALQDIVRNSMKPVLADEFMGLVPLAGQQLAFQPFEFKQLVIAKVWDETPFLESIQQKKYGAILLYDPPGWDSRHARWTESQLNALEANYTWAGRYADTIVYEPK